MSETFVFFVLFDEFVIFVVENNFSFMSPFTFFTSFSHCSLEIGHLSLHLLVYGLSVLSIDVQPIFNYKLFRYNFRRFYYNSPMLQFACFYSIFAIPFFSISYWEFKSFPMIFNFSFHFIVEETHSCLGYLVT